MDTLTECEDSENPVAYNNEDNHVESEITTNPQTSEYTDPVEPIPVFKLCRLCGTSDSVHNHIFDPKDDLNMKMAYMQIQVALDDRLPQHVCDHCRSQVLTLHGFCHEAQLMQERLLSMLADAEGNKELQDIPPPLRDMPPPSQHLPPPSQDLPPRFLEIPPPGIKQDATTQTECHIEISPDIDLGIGLFPVKQEMDGFFEAEEAFVAINPWDDVAPQTSVKVESATRNTSKQRQDGLSYLQELKKLRPDLQIKVKCEQSPSAWSGAYLDLPEHVEVKALKTDPDYTPLPKSKKKSPAKKKPNKNPLKSLRGNVTIKKIKVKKAATEISNANGEIPLKIEKEDPDSDSGLVNLEDYMKMQPKVTKAAKVKKDNMYTCCVCSKTLQDRETCLEHYQTHSEAGDPEPPPAPPLPTAGRCPRCSKVLADSDAWAEHWRRHWLRDRPAHRCVLCPAELHFRKIQEIVEHGISYHARENDGHCNAKYKCDMCTTKFVQMKSFRRHRMIKHPDTGQPMPHCARCNFKSTSVTALRNHFKLKHDANPQLCPHCGKTFGHTHHLKRHMLLHTGEKPFKCRFCGKGFASPAYLPDHERTHTGEKPFVCGECGRGFSQRSSLVTHERSVHSHERPFVCQLCGRGFAAKGFLTTHMKTACI